MEIQCSFLLTLLSGKCSHEVSGARFFTYFFLLTFCNSLSPLVSTHTSVSGEDHVPSVSAGSRAWGFDGSPFCRAEGSV